MMRVAFDVQSATVKDTMSSFVKLAGKIDDVFTDIRQPTAECQ